MYKKIRELFEGKSTDGLTDMGARVLLFLILLFLLGLAGSIFEHVLMPVFSLTFGPVVDILIYLATGEWP